MVAVNIEPYNQERLKGGRQKITLYFVGWEFYQLHKGFPPPITTKTMAFQLPALGESITIDEVFAKDLMFKSRYNGKPCFVAEADGGAEMAKLLKKAIKNNRDLSELNLESLRVREQASVLTDDDLLALVRQRNLSIPTEAFLQEDEHLVEEEQEAPQKRVGRPPSKKDGE